MSMSTDHSALLESSRETKVADANGKTDENTPQHSCPTKHNISNVSPQSATVGQDIRQASRSPMTGLSQNPLSSSSTANGPLLTAVNARTPEGPSSSVAGARFGGSTTHRDSRQISSRPWLPASSSGAFTARGSASPPGGAAPKPPARFNSVPVQFRQPSSYVAAKAAALNPQAVPYVPHGGSCPSIQDSMAHADAALHLLKQVVEKESWYGHGVLATVQKKEAELQEILQGLQQEVNRLVQDKQEGLDQLKQLSGQQQVLHQQLSQAHQECDASDRQLERLHRENQTLQDRIAAVQRAAQQSIADAHALTQQANSLTQKQLQLHASVEQLKAVQQSAQQQSTLYESICQALEASLADSSTAANTAESASQQRQTAVIQLVQQSVSVLGLDPEQLFPGVLQRLKDTFRGDYEQKLKIADKKAIMAQAEVAVASAQNTSRSPGHAFSPAPALSLDLKSLSLRETFHSLTDSSRSRAASARTASGLSARQPLSASDRFPNVPSGGAGACGLPSLSEEPVPARNLAVEDKQDSLPSGRLCSSRHAEGTVSAGSSEYSSRSSSFYSSTNSSRSSSPIGDDNASVNITTQGSYGVSQVADAPEILENLHGVAAGNTSVNTLSDRSSSHVSAIRVVPSLSARLRLPLLPLANCLPSAGATPRSVRFQLHDPNADLDMPAIQGAVLPVEAILQPSDVTSSPRQPAETTISTCESSQQGSRELQPETSFAFGADAEPTMTAGPVMSSACGSADDTATSPSQTSSQGVTNRCIHCSPGITDLQKDPATGSDPVAESSMPAEIQDGDSDNTGTLTTWGIEALIARMQHRFEVTNQDFEQGRFEAKKGLAGLPE